MLLLKPYVWRLLDVNVHGVSNLDHVEGPFVAVANHSSHLDTALIFGGMPQRLARYMATAAAGDHWFSKWYRSLVPTLFFNAFPVERGRGHGKRGIAGSLLSDGVPLLIYPEGTRSRDGALGRFNPGSAALSISRGVPCLPIAIVGAYAAWPSYQKHLPTGRPPVHVVFGHPMSPLRGEIAHAFSERIRQRIIELHDGTARAYGMKTLAEYARTAALAKSQRVADADSGKPDQNGPSPLDTTKTDDNKTDNNKSHVDKSDDKKSNTSSSDQ